MKAVVKLRILGHLTRAAMVSEFPEMPRTMMMMVTTPLNWRNANDELQLNFIIVQFVELDLTALQLGGERKLNKFLYMHQLSSLYVQKWEKHWKVSNCWKVESRAEWKTTTFVLRFVNRIAEILCTLIELPFSTPFWFIKYYYSQQEKEEIN